MTDQNEMILIYEIIENYYIKQIKIFNHNFVEENKSNCKIFINDKEQDLCDNIDINSVEKNKPLKIKLVETKPIKNMSYMFAECTLLSPLSDFSKWNTINVTDMSYMFSKCHLISSLPDISNWNTSNVKNMSFIFFSMFFSQIFT